jgi:Na+-transporting methylmalonyl-CoA/oxaloacetate decarboxylase gamma subunit
MNALNDIATTGAPVIVSALGMGTVFLCLMLLYLMTRIVGGLLPRLLRSAEAAASARSVESATEVEAAEIPAAEQVSPAGNEAIVAAATLVLARHRLSRMRPAVEEPRGADAWKMAGRIRTLRVR